MSTAWVCRVIRVTVVGVIAVVAATPVVLNAGEAGDTPGEAKPLFNGNDLTGWTQATGAATYEVEPGAGGEPAAILGKSIQNDSVNSFLATDQAYSDFILEYDFKVDPSLNSGVQIRSFVNPSNRVQGYQVEIDPSTRAWSGGLYEEQGRGWLEDLSDNQPAREAFIPGGWNHIKVVVEGPSVKTWINDVMAVDYTETNASIPTSGFIALQVHTTGTAGLKVRWRNITLTELPLPTPEGDLNGDGYVGIEDLNIVLGLWNNLVSDNHPSDPSGDNYVGIEDLNVVLGNWNLGTPPTAPFVVPEPGGAAVLGLTLMMRVTLP